MELALFEPDIPQNTGTLIRLCACLAVPLHIIEPCGFAFSEAKMKRAMMDYVDLAHITRHNSWQAFLTARNSKPSGRLILLSTHANTAHIDFAFARDDMLLLGRESSGAPQYVHDTVDEKVKIPLAPNARSLNVAIAGAMVLGEALRQTKGFPSLQEA